ncbi:hypothetical protein A2763_00575 [Candidatus Kaiserbacteria bacterium RIFCSPHIGHO2_01_FULL_54_36]|uniref:Uncharacterized protein n=1 Tax=Candidatus Kaiserbacteria bacterium RIFCSPHIGHO2_01_FULL_54_36 TaxID=1798482 RepID=A0A1F6CMB3_9BACT|nr:MAG: hypothetical protein A2763_00575 [Candidatus Kaiserbacteria bacterium RIFCSPHIGHO2_01_FULL_54_36]OGG75348.1 MAG: hypothetical protein A3A41_01695 [Candidatus Kaiserbacteria bacterium RIFCSPLOWO2_01_FULL_54_22]
MEGAAKANPGRSGLILGISLALGLLFDYFFFDKFPIGIGFTAYMALVTAAFFGIAHVAKKPIRGDLLWLFPLLLFFAAMVAVRASMLLTALNVLACAGLLLVIMEVRVRGLLRQFVASDFLALLIPFKVIDPLIQSFADLLSMRHFTDSNRAKQIVRGILISIPVLVIFSLLFASADPVFGKYISALIDWNFAEEDIVRIIAAVVITVGFIAAFSYAFAGVWKPLFAEGDEKRPIGHIETAILLGSVNALFLAFIVIQIAYLFGGESNITAQGYTYAEYARRGFFELVAVAVLSYLVLVVTERFIEKNAENHSRTFKILSSAVIVQVGVIMASAFFRMWLYEEAFGFTTLRVYVHAFIVLLGFVFACLLYKILVENKDNTFAFRTFLAIVVFIVGMNLFNPDAFIAKKNLERYAAMNDLDAEYLAVLSSDATPAMLSGLSAVEGRAQYEIGHELYKRMQQQRPQRWMSWNWSREEERKILIEEADELRKYENSPDLVYPAANSDEL